MTSVGPDVSLFPTIKKVKIYSEQVVTRITDIDVHMY